MVVKYLTNAKINLLLDITGTLPNGYHAIHTVMQSVELVDEVTVEAMQAGIAVTCSDAAIPSGEQNICHKAAALFLDAAQIKNGVRVHIEKNIPSGAGLAGGSADAAGTLLALNALFGELLPLPVLLRLGLQCGADVPFCLRGGMALCQNMGEVLSPLPSTEGYTIVLAKGAAGVVTGEAYAAVDKAAALRHPDRDRFLFYAAAGNAEQYLPLCANVFEQVIDVAGRAEHKAVMRRHGSLAECMSGSGSALYGIFRGEQEAEACAAALRETVPFVCVCHPAAVGCVRK